MVYIFNIVYTFYTSFYNFATNRFIIDPPYNTGNKDFIYDDSFFNNINVIIIVTVEDKDFSLSFSFILKKKLFTIIYLKYYKLLYI